MSIKKLCAYITTFSIFAVNSYFIYYFTLVHDNHRSYSSSEVPIRHTDILWQGVLFGAMLSVIPISLFLFQIWRNKNITVVFLFSSLASAYTFYLYFFELVRNTHWHPDEVVIFLGGTGVQIILSLVSLAYSGLINILNKRFKNETISIDLEPDVRPRALAAAIFCIAISALISFAGTFILKGQSSSCISNYSFIITIGCFFSCIFLYYKNNFVKWIFLLFCLGEIFRFSITLKTMGNSSELAIYMAQIVFRLSAGVLLIFNSSSKWLKK